jgi:hypothetical protein
MKVLGDGWPEETASGMLEAAAGSVRGTCRHCDTPLPDDADPRRKYCSTKCKKAFMRQLKKEEREAEIKTRRSHSMIEAREATGQHDELVREFKSRAFDKIEDEVRDVMREEIRKALRPMIRDKALGAANLLVEMLPMALARVYQDLESKDTIARRAATALVMKYAMPMVETDEDKNSNNQLVIAYNIPSGHTVTVGAPEELEEIDAEVVDESRPFDEIVTEVLESGDDDEEDVEAFEKDWYKCPSCNVRKHPENLVTRSGVRICKSCNVRAQINGGERPAGLMGNPLYA